ncbi:MAG: hypothetical protein ACLFVU_01010 [Phycisphaerae bacterium]
MRLSKYFLVSLVTFGLIASVLLSGCSDSESRSQTKALQEQVKLAQRHIGSALTSMKTYTLRFDGKPGPITSDIGYDAEELETSTVRREVAQRITSVDPDDPNPNAEESLNKAIKLLDEALAAYPQADDLQKAIARAQLAAAQKALVAYHDTVAAQNYRSALRAGNEYSELTATVGTLVERAKYYDRLIGMSDEQVRQMLSETTEEVETLKGELAVIDGRIKQLEEEQTTLEERRQSLEAKSADFKIEARLSKGENGQELLDKAEAVDQQVIKTMSRLREIQMELGGLESEQKEKQAALNSAQARKEATAKSLEARDAGKKREKALREDLVKNYRDKAEQARTILDTIAQSTTAAKEAEDKALELLEVAAKNLEQARQMLSGQTETSFDNELQKRELISVLTSLGDIYMAEGNLRAQRLRFDRRLQEIVGMTRTSFDSSVAAADFPQVETLEGYVADRAAIAARAEEAFTEAADAYLNVEGRVDRANRWLIEGHIAAAKIGEAQMAADQTVRSDAIDLARTKLESALEGKANSEYLQDVKELQRTLVGME